MTLPPELRSDATQVLRPAAADQQPVADPRPVTAPTPTARQSIKRRVRSSVGRVARPALNKIGPVIERAQRGTETQRHALDAANRRIDELERRLFDQAGQRVDLALMQQRLESNEINQTLQKADFGDVLRRFEALGAAIAPGAGIDAAAVRLAEQREQLHSLDRRLRVLDSRVNTALVAPQGAPPLPTAAPAATPAVTTSVEPAVAAPDVEKHSAGFDYVGFEGRFRGEPDEILRVQRERYIPILTGHGPVVDIGCGRGELLDALREAGIDGIGVEPEPGMAAEARARGLVVEQTDALGFLRAQEPDSLGAVFSAHVLEHLELDYLLEFIQLSLSRLRPGGVFVAETPNPASLIVLGNSYILDPTHVWPLHPSLTSFLCESAGFRDIHLAFHAPATGYHLPKAEPQLGDLARVVNEGFSRLNDVLFGPQDYTIVATKAAS
ncbi:hypothetical protein ASD16_03445 [Cellulomonas sp. Root485]|uniref:class I SAM-dependent methyltransferase n=1 Tax=Cellulomonas sp. Root485 TaxID=1736546 RepID=UPI0006FCE337|nr:class I SAM-dependent methyltransferase [Cellulomonas sp. Root485]KQY24589.1 hypothetical protein ASD16_03445 [Cellulomonas sp. Root485]